MESRKPSFGIIYFGFGLILSGLFRSFVLLDYDHFAYMFGFQSSKMLTFSYLIAWIDKFLLLASAIGVLYLKEKFRKLIILTWFLEICAVPWKYPFPGFKNTFLQLVHYGFFNQKIIEAQFVTFDSFVYIIITTAALLDAVYGLALIYFFTRPKIKAQFK